MRLLLRFFKIWHFCLNVSLHDTCNRFLGNHAFFCRRDTLIYKGVARASTDGPTKISVAMTRNSVTYKALLWWIPMTQKSSLACALPNCQIVTRPFVSNPYKHRRVFTLVNIYNLYHQCRWPIFLKKFLTKQKHFKRVQNLLIFLSKKHKQK